MLGLYIHIPFCAAICNYCNFNRGLFDPALSVRYLDALVAEIAAAGAAVPGRPADTLYFGGGTPSLLEPGQVARIVDACAAAFPLAPDREVTLEVNPETVTAESLAAFRAAGVNRVSIGVQSFRDDELGRLSRLHSADRARAALAEARAAGFDNVSLDLMMWLPGQRVDQWLESIEQAIALAPDHLSLYLLEVYPNAPLKDDMARARWSQAPDDDAATMYVAAMERLEAAGYAQYEISNVARPGRQSRHNMKYWTDGAWIGVGCGAHSTLDGVRWKNVSGTEDYIDRLGRGASTRVEVRQLSADEQVGEALLMGLRLSEGIDESVIRARYGIDVWARYGQDLAPSLEAGLLIRKNGRMSLTRQGMLLANEVMVAFV